MSSDLERLIRYIYDSTELLSVTSVYLDSEKKRANLLLFLQYARDYEQSGGDGVAGFLRFIDSVYSNDNAFKQSGKITASGDSVNVMTYHASKGLEFPYVFLCDLVYSKNSGSESIYMHHKVSDDPLDVDSFAFETADTIQDMIRTNIYFKDMQDKSVLEDRSEKLRLFYVGCTRAKEKLFLSLSPKCNGNTKAQTGRNNVKSIFKQACECDDADRLEKLVSQCDNMLYWLMCGLSRFCIGKDFARWLNGEYDPENEKASDEAEDFEFQVCDIRKPKINAVLDFLTTDTDEGTLADEITEETGLNDVRIVIKEPRIRQMEHALGEHVELLAERVQDHERKGDQGNEQPEHCQNGRDRPGDPAFSLLFAVIDFYSFIHINSPPLPQRSG